MKAVFTLTSVLLVVSPALAGLIPSNGVLPGSPPSRRGVGKANGISERAICSRDNVLRALLNPTRSAGASTFCSAYLQPTTTITSTATISITSLTTTTATTTTSTTITGTATSVATTVLCPAATVTTTCNYPAYGYGTYLISQTPNIDPIVCHENCLQDPNCQSFQVESGGSMYCNLYNVPTSGNVQYAPGGGYNFFDRDCSDLLPNACSAGSNAAARKRDIEARAATIPENLSTVLATVPATRISSACSCLITSPSATATATIPASTTTLTETTVEVVVTTTGTEVDSVTVTVTATTAASP